MPPRAKIGATVCAFLLLSGCGGEPPPVDLDGFLSAMTQMYAPFPGIVTGWTCQVEHMKRMDPSLWAPEFEELDPPAEVRAAMEQLLQECPIPFDDLDAALRRPDGTMAPMPDARSF